MQQPRLTIVAGCNGSGKSTYSKSLVPEDVKPFDYDKLFLEVYRNLPDSELREEFARQQVTKELEDLITSSVENRISCCFETNLMNVPITWINQFREKGFLIELFFFCLESLEKAKERVTIRIKNNGHYVSDEVIEIKWKDGYKNINNYFPEFDRVVFIDNSNDNDIPAWLFELTKIGQTDYEIVQFCNSLPEYAQHRLPAIFELLT